MANVIVLEVLEFVRPIRLQVEDIDVARRRFAMRWRWPKAMRRVARSRSASMLAADLPSIQGDPHQLRQIFTNLLDQRLRGDGRLAARCASSPRGAAAGKNQSSVCEPQAGPSLLNSR